ncbi:MAG: aspartate-semialdehyde dehydrogenase [Candidatus Omnitrophica bacterium]|nr:aspartate-semialdehyde dehydrogenase [Candidatus Omnitrophota bacterium]
MKKVNLAVVGVGAVGVEIMRILKQRDFPINSLKVFARSARQIDIDGNKYNVEAIADENFSNVDIALFAGTEGEKGAATLYADKFVKKGAVVVDNGADFRMKDDVPLVVPEVNCDAIASNKGIIANPNCTTIQALVALGGIYKKFGMEKIVLTSFQATSGAGKSATVGLWEETKELIAKNDNVSFDNISKKVNKPIGFESQIAFNAIPKIGGYGDDNYTSEEWKVVNETHKIFADNKIKITATCVRIPVFTSHSEAIYFRTKEDTGLSGIEEALKGSKGVVYTPDSFALPLDVEGKDDVYVSRVRRDRYEKNSFWLWCVADNLRKGAALNAIQIAENLL